MDKTIELLKQAQAHLQAKLARYDALRKKEQVILAAFETIVKQSREIADLLRSDLNGDSHSNGDAVPKLSAREDEIFKLMGQNISLKEIAKRLGISIHTLYAHRRRIVKRLGLENSYELKRFSREQFEREK